MSLFLYIFVATILFFPLLSWAKDDDKTSVLIVGGDKASQSFAADVARDQKKLNQKRAKLKAIEKEIAEGKYEVNIEKLKNYLAAGKMWEFFNRRILEDLVRANAGAGHWGDAILYQQKIMTSSVKGNWNMEYISAYWRLLEDYQTKVPNAVIEEKIPVDPDDLTSFIEKRKKYYVGGIENNKLFLADMANYYMVRLDLEKAEEYLLKGLNTKERGRFGKEFDKEIIAMLRNIYILKGRYADAIKENDKLLKEIHWGYEDELAIFLNDISKNNPSPKKLEFEFSQRNFKGRQRA